MNQINTRRPTPNPTLTHSTNAWAAQAPNGMVIANLQIAEQLPPWMVQNKNGIAQHLPSNTPCVGSHGNHNGHAVIETVRMATLWATRGAKTLKMIGTNDDKFNNCPSHCLSVWTNDPTTLQTTNDNVFGDQPNSCGTNALLDGVIFSDSV